MSRRRTPRFELLAWIGSQVAGDGNGSWSAEACGRDGNEFCTVAEARSAARAIRKEAGWEDARFAIRDRRSGLVWVLPVETVTVKRIGP